MTLKQAVEFALRSSLRLQAERVLRDIVQGNGISQQQAVWSEDEEDVLYLRCLFVVDLNKPAHEKGNAKYIAITVCSPHNKEQYERSSKALLDNINLMREGKY